MADESDYTKMWNGVFTPPRVGDDDRGIYLLDDEESVGRNTRIYDDCTRGLYDEAHPRTHPGGQRYPGPYGAGRASDRIGPSLHERKVAARRRNARYAGEGFTSSGGLDDSYEEDRDLYIQGSRRVGHPGPRGMVTSARENRAAVDAVTWDNRPPHFADDTPNEYAHLYIDPEARGPPLFQKNTTYPGFRQVDRFKASASWTPTSTIAAVIFIVVLILVAMWLMVSGIEGRISRELSLAVREMRAAG